MKKMKSVTNLPITYMVATLGTNKKDRYYIQSWYKEEDGYQNQLNLFDHDTWQKNPGLRPYPFQLEMATKCVEGSKKSAPIDIKIMNNGVEILDEKLKRALCNNMKIFSTQTTTTVSYNPLTPQALKVAKEAADLRAELNSIFNNGTIHTFDINKCKKIKQAFAAVK